jgi:hypothetical protein
VTVTEQRKKPAFTKEIKGIIDLPRYQSAAKTPIVLDNLNTHFEKSFTETFGGEKTKRVRSRIQFHYTPKAASWLNMAEIEIGIFSRRSSRGRIPTEEKLVEHARLG